VSLLVKGNSNSSCGVPFGYTMNIDLLHNLVGKGKKPRKLYRGYEFDYPFMEKNK